MSMSRFWRTRFIDSERRFVIDFAHGLQLKFNNPQDQKRRSEANRRSKRHRKQAQAICEDPSGTRGNIIGSEETPQEDVGGRPEENRCCTTGAMGEGKGGKEGADLKSTEATQIFRGVVL